MSLKREEKTAEEFANKTKDFSHGTPNYPPIIQPLFVDYSDKVDYVDVFTSARAFLDSLPTQTRLFTETMPSFLHVRLGGIYIFVFLGAGEEFRPASLQIRTEQQVNVYPTNRPC